MTFVDGENFTIEGEKLAAARGLQLTEGSHFRRGIYLWLPPLRGPETDLVGLRQAFGWGDDALRAHYYTMVQGSQATVAEIQRALWQIGFHPEVFHKPKGLRAKGVDITLARDMLGHAYKDNYDLAVLVAGDGDYAPLVEEVKRLGKLVLVAFFDGPTLHDDLKLAADDFRDISSWFAERWTAGQQQ